MESSTSEAEDWDRPVGFSSWRLLVAGDFKKTTLDPDVAPIKNGDFPAIAMLDYWRVDGQ